MSEDKADDAEKEEENKLLPSLAKVEVLLSTERGLPRFLTYDQFSKIDHFNTPFKGFYLEVSDIFMNSGRVPLADLLKTGPMTMSQYYNIPDAIESFISCSLSRSKKRNIGGKDMKIQSPYGNMTVTAEKYCDFINTLKPHSFSLLSESQPLNVSKSRASKTQKRNFEKYELQRKFEFSFEPRVYFCVEATNHPKTLQKYVEYVRDANAKHVLIAGLGFDESKEERLAVLENVFGLFKRMELDFRRVAICGVEAPDEIAQVRRIAAGHSLLFLSSWPARATSQDEALLPRLWMSSGSNSEDRFDARSELLAEDTRPLAPDCLCHPCRTGVTRAYMRHLLNAEEIVGKVFLQRHNVHSYLTRLSARAKERRKAPTRE